MGGRADGDVLQALHGELAVSPEGKLVFVQGTGGREVGSTFVCSGKRVTANMRMQSTGLS